MLGNQLKRNITAEEIDLYRENGAAVIRDVLDHDWVDYMRKAIEERLTMPNPGGVEYTQSTGKTGRYYGDVFTWRKSEGVRKFFFESPMVELAAQVMGSEMVRVFYDQLLVKEPEANAPTPIHQDIAYWPVRGEDILSVWVPFDDVTRDTGMVQYVNGSHQWGQEFGARAFGQNSEYEKTAALQGKKLSVEDVEANLDQYEISCWDVNVGDVVIHHANTLHFSEGNTSHTQRRRGNSTPVPG